MKKLSTATTTLILIIISPFAFGAENNYLLDKDNFSNYTKALEEQDYDALYKYYSEDIVVKFGETVLNRDEVIEYEKGQAEFVSATMQINKIIGDEAGIAIDATQIQTLVITPPGGSDKEGDRFKSHIIVFYELTDGKISGIEVFGISSEKME